MTALRKLPLRMVLPEVGATASVHGTMLPAAQAAGAYVRQAQGWLGTSRGASRQLFKEISDGRRRIASNALATGAERAFLGLITDGNGPALAEHGPGVGNNRTCAVRGTFARDTPVHRVQLLSTS